MQYIRTPQEAEQNAALKMRDLGFPDAAKTVGGADGGIDVRASGALAQVKWRGGMVGRPEIQNLFGARGSDFSKKLLFFSASGYSQHAIEYANSNGIALFVYEPDGRLVPKNPAARSLTDSPKPGAPTPSISPKPVTQAASSQSLSYSSLRKTKPGFRHQPEGQFLAKHWRAIGTFIFTMGSISMIYKVIDPDESLDETRLGNVGYLVLTIVCAVVFWLLYIGDRRRKKSEKHI